MIGRQHGEGALDLAALARDDVLLDLLGAREAVTDPGDDPVVALLTALTTDVDSDLAELLARPLVFEKVADVADPDVRRRRVIRATAAALVVGLTLSVGGVSAAVTGDPLSAYRSVVGIFDADSELPPTAAEIARWNKRIAAARKAVRGGDADAPAVIAALESALAGATDLPPGQRAVIARKLAALRQQLADASDAARGPASGPKDKGKPAGGTGKPTDQPGGRPTDQPGGKKADQPAGKAQKDNGSGEARQPDRADVTGSTSGREQPQVTADPERGGGDEPQPAASGSPGRGSGATKSQGRRAPVPTPAAPATDEVGSADAAQAPGPAATSDPNGASGADREQAPRR